MTELVPFDYSGREVRTVLVDDEPWFVATDICAVLGIKNTSSTVSGLDEDERGSQSFDTPGGRQELLTINESGLYTILIRARGSAREAAKPFRRWVTHDVLPAIRRTGTYVAPVVASGAVVARPGSQLDVLAAVVAEMQRVETLVLNAGQDAHVANARIDAIEGRHDWFSALGYAKTHGLPTDSMSLARFGKLAATIARSQGVDPNKVQHAHFGAVNEFPVQIWHQAAAALGGVA